ncbi:MAG: hypothetical protein HY040_06140 [Planctomycetes bacterium]|nr:hypothetical protein [Planctomycetota bacterium]
MFWNKTLPLAGLVSLAFIGGCRTTSYRPAYAVQPTAAAAPAPCCNQPAAPGATYAPATTIPPAPPPPGVLSR